MRTRMSYIDNNSSHTVAQQSAPQAVSPSVNVQHAETMHEERPSIGAGCALLRYDGVSDPRTLVGVIVKSFDQVVEECAGCATIPGFLIARSDVITLMPKFQVQTLKYEHVTAVEFDRNWTLYARHESPVLDQLRHLLKLQGFASAAMAAARTDITPSSGIPRPRGRAPHNKTWNMTTGSWVPFDHTPNTDWELARMSRRDNELREFVLRVARIDTTLTQVRVMPFDDGTFFRSRTSIEGDAPAMRMGELILQWNPPAVTQMSLNALVGECGLYDGDVPFDVEDGIRHTLVASSLSGTLCGAMTIRIARAKHITLDVVTVLFVELIAVLPGQRKSGLASRMLDAALSLARMNERPIVLLCEATQSGPGWAWWKHRVSPKLPLAVVLLLQIIVCIDNSEMAVGAMPCGSLLLR